MGIGWLQFGKGVQKPFGEVNVWEIGRFGQSHFRPSGKNGMGS
jgi:hypothetical protein